MIPKWLQELAGIAGPPEETIDSALDEILVVLNRSKVDVARLIKEESGLEDSRDEIEGKLDAVMSKGRDAESLDKTLAVIRERLDAVIRLRVSLQEDIWSFEQIVQRERLRWLCVRAQETILEARKRFDHFFGSGSELPATIDSRLQEGRRGLFELRRSVDELLDLTSYPCTEIQQQEGLGEGRIRKMTPAEEEITGCDCCGRPGTADVIVVVGDQHLCLACITRAHELARESENDHPDETG